MANRNYNRKQALEKEIKSLYADVAIGSSGAATVTKALGIATVAKSATGRYTVTLDDKYTRLMHVDVVLLDSASKDLTFQLVSETVSSTKVIIFACKAAATDTDPSDGDRLLIKIDLKNSSSGE